MSDWLYDWLKDFAVPALSGLGGIVVGAGAYFVARRSHELATQVRTDAKDREEAAAKERYRDHLFQVVESTMTAILTHRAEIMTTFRLAYAAEGILRSEVFARLLLSMAVANEEDVKVIQAVREAFTDVIATGRVHVVGIAGGDLVVVLGSLLSEKPDITRLVNQARTTVSDATAAAAAAATGPAKPTSPSAPTAP